MSHIILINSERDQVETHKVDRDKFLQVWDLLHEKAADDVLDGLAFGAAATVPAISDAMHNSSFEEPEVEYPGDFRAEKMNKDLNPEPEVIREQDSDAAFLSSLQALMG